MATLHIGLIGCGRWGQHILNDLKSLGCKVTVVCRSEESVSRAKKFNADNIIDHWQKLPKELSAIVIATPSSNHYQMIKNLASIGVPMLAEKTTAQTPAQAKELLSLTTPLFVTSKFRYHPGILQLKAIAASEKLGKPKGISTKSHRWGINHTDADAIEILIPHELAIISEILGRTPTLQQSSINYWDNDKIHLRALFKDELFAQLDVCSYASETKREVTLICERGIAVLPDIRSDHITIHPAPGNQTSIDGAIETISLDHSPPLLEELKAYTQHLNGGPQPKTSSYDAFKQSEIMLELRDRSLQL